MVKPLRIMGDDERKRYALDLFQKYVDDDVSVMDSLAITGMLASACVKSATDMDKVMFNSYINNICGVNSEDAIGNSDNE